MNLFLGMDKMFLRRGRQRAVVARMVAGLVLLAASIGAAKTARSEEGVVAIDSKKKQRIEIMGGNMERSAAGIHKASNAQEILEWCIRDINFNFFRVKYDKQQEMTEGVKTFECYDQQVKTMKAIRALNPDIKFLATNKSDYNGYGGGNCNNFPTFIYDYATSSADKQNRVPATGTRAFDAQKYGAFLADYVEYMHRKGVPIDYIATAKEYTGVVTAQRSHDAYESMVRELKNRKVPVPEVIGPASHNIRGGLRYLRDVDDLGYEDEYDFFSTHNLKRTPELWRDYADACSKLGKKAIDDESSNASGGPTFGEEPEIELLLDRWHEKCLMYDAGLVGELFFEIWSRGIGRETRSVYFNRGQPGKRLRSYYVMKDFANSAVNNYYCSSDASATPYLSSMVFRDDSRVHVWLVNQNRLSIEDLTIKMSGKSIYYDVEHKYWDSAEPLPVTEMIPNERFKTVSVNLPAQSLNYIQFMIKK